MSSLKLTLCKVTVLQSFPPDSPKAEQADMKPAGKRYKKCRFTMTQCIYSPHQSQRWSHWAAWDTLRPCCSRPAQCRSRWSWQWRRTTLRPGRRTGSTGPRGRKSSIKTGLIELCCLKEVQRQTLWEEEITRHQSVSSAKWQESLEHYHTLTSKTNLPCIIYTYCSVI